MGKACVLQRVWIEISCVLRKCKWSLCVCQQWEHPHCFSLTERRAARSQENKSLTWDSEGERSIISGTLGHVVEAKKSRERITHFLEKKQVRRYSLNSVRDKNRISSNPILNLLGEPLPVCWTAYPLEPVSWATICPWVHSAHPGACACSPRTCLAFDSWSSGSQPS